jgi:hypothetical protein
MEIDGISLVKLTDAQLRKYKRLIEKELAKRKPEKSEEQIIDEKLKYMYDNYFCEEIRNGKPGYQVLGFRDEKKQPIPYEKFRKYMIDWYGTEKILNIKGKYMDYSCWLESEFKSREEKWRKEIRK